MKPPDGPCGLAHRVVFAKLESDCVGVTILRPCASRLPVVNPQDTVAGRWCPSIRWMLWCLYLHECILMILVGPLVPRYSESKNSAPHRSAASAILATKTARAIIKYLFEMVSVTASRVSRGVDNCSTRTYSPKQRAPSM